MMLSADANELPCCLEYSQTLISGFPRAQLVMAPTLILGNSYVSVLTRSPSAAVLLLNLCLIVPPTPYTKQCSLTKRHLEDF